ncbi:MAG: hypothetical protein CMB80_28555 [Flammeovirgaceae bacterium]|nr:hypothetical protein [Flammeovirgaceae bacterium]|tara:strand:- start:1084 stop:1506 length:423 start_codon:yes stop_codon:yes gene_type:complete
MDEFCGICLDEFENKPITLKCKHKYCYECILQSYMNNINKKRECPYCRSQGGYLPLPPDTKPIKYIHIEYILMNLPHLPLHLGINSYQKNILTEVAKKLGISIHRNNGRIKLKRQLYEDIKTHYTENPEIIEQYNSSTNS